MFRFIGRDDVREEAYTWKKMEKFSDLNGFDDMLAAFKGGGDFFCVELPSTQLTPNNIKDFISLLAFMEINEEFSFCSFRRNHALLTEWNRLQIQRPSNELIRWMERINVPSQRNYGDKSMQPVSPRLICVLNQKLGMHDHQTLVSNFGRMLSFSDQRLLSPEQKNILIKATRNLIVSNVPMHLHDPCFLPLMEFNKLLSDLEFRAREINAVNEVTGVQPVFSSLVKQHTVFGVLKSNYLSENKKFILIKVLSYMKNFEYVELDSDRVSMFPVNVFWRWMESSDSDLQLEDLL